VNPQNSNTPFKEAVSIITIGSVLVAIVAYAGTAQGMPVLSAGILCIGNYVCRFLPYMPGFQVTALIGAATIGGTCYVFGIPLASLLAKKLARSQIENVERHTDDLRRTRAKILRSERKKDDFIVR
jgi:hypothetical protein